MDGGAAQPQAKWTAFYLPLCSPGVASASHDREREERALRRFWMAMLGSCLVRHLAAIGTLSPLGHIRVLYGGFPSPILRKV